MSWLRFGAVMTTNRSGKRDRIGLFEQLFIHDALGFCVRDLFSGTVGIAILLVTR